MGSICRDDGFILKPNILPKWRFAIPRQCRQCFTATCNRVKGQKMQITKRDKSLICCERKNEGENEVLVLIEKTGDVSPDALS